MGAVCRLCGIAIKATLPGNTLFFPDCTGCRMLVCPLCNACASGLSKFTCAQCKVHELISKDGSR